MKTVEQQIRGIEVGGVGETVKFSIAASGKIIKNVIQSIYSQKERTVVRELIANALDGHAANGCKDKVRVYLPTALDPKFVVRDFGGGMDHNFVMRLYSAIGFSTKEDTNDATGMFGVGSKSPLSITDTFTVRCFDPETATTPARVRMYTVSITDDDVPQISHTFDVKPRPEDMVERGGVEVSVPISANSVRDIKAGVADQYLCWFDQPVEFLESELDTPPFENITVLSPGVIVADKKGYRSEKVFVRQGSAIYPLQTYTLQSKGHELDSISKAIIDQASGGHRVVVFDVPIGTADVTMARENLQYNDTSCANLKKAIQEKCQKYAEVVITKVGDAKSFADALIRIAGSNNYEEAYAARWVKPIIETTILNNYKNGYPVYRRYHEEPHYIQILETSKDAKFLGMRVVCYSSNVGSSTLGRGEDMVGINPLSVVYLIPSHEPEWETRITEHAKTVEGIKGLPLVVIRTAKRNVPVVKGHLRRYTNILRVYDPSVLRKSNVVINKSSPSRSSVYKWDSNKYFGGDKVEPDYTQPAYFFIREGVTHDVFLSCEVIGLKTDMRGSVSNYVVSDFIKKAKDAGLFDSRPIYRVSVHQAKRIMKDVTCPWEHAPTLLNDFAKEMRDNRSDSIVFHEVLNRAQRSKLECAEFKRAMTGKMSAAVNAFIDERLRTDRLFRVVWALSEQSQEPSKLSGITQSQFYLLTKIQAYQNLPDDGVLSKVAQQMEKVLDQFREVYLFPQKILEHDWNGVNLSTASKVVKDCSCMIPVDSQIDLPKDILLALDAQFKLKYEDKPQAA